MLYQYSDSTGKKNVHYFLTALYIFMRQSGDTLFLFAVTGYLCYLMLCAVFSHAISSKEFHSLPEVVWKSTEYMKTLII